LGISELFSDEKMLTYEKPVIVDYDESYNTKAMSEDEIKRLIVEADIDGNGTIDKNEFKSMIYIEIVL